MSSASINSTALTKLQTVTAQNSCNDAFTFGYRVADLESECGLSTTNVDPTNQSSLNWIRYRGDHYIYYNETVAVSLNGDQNTQNLTRIGRLVTPIDVFIERLYSSQLDTTTSILVYSPYQLKAAITSTTVKANATTAYVSLTFGVSSPYEIDYMTTRTPTGGGGYTSGLQTSPNNLKAYVVSASNNNNALAQQSVSQTDGVGLTPCAAQDYDANGFCWRTVAFILILDDGVCSLANTLTIDTIAIKCNAQYSGADCPLNPNPNTDSALQFTINADNFCNGQRALVINDVIGIKAFIPQRARSRTDTSPLRSFRINELAYLTLFIDTENSLQVFDMQLLSAADGGFQTKLNGGTYTTPDAADGANGYIELANGKANDDGFNVPTQTYSLTVTLGCAFVQDGTLGQQSRNCLVNPGMAYILHCYY